MKQTSDNLSVDPKLVKELKEHSRMLGRICVMVEEFCEGEETTEQGVAKLLAYYCEYRAKEAWERYERLMEEV
jgi:hypothetical protein